jgi:hypothetical protein
MEKRGIMNSINISGSTSPQLPEDNPPIDTNQLLIKALDILLTQVESINKLDLLIRRDNVELEQGNTQIENLEESSLDYKVIHFFSYKRELNALNKVISQKKSEIWALKKEKGGLEKALDQSGKLFKKILRSYEDHKNLSTSEYETFLSMKEKITPLMDKGSDKTQEFLKEINRTSLLPLLYKFKPSPTSKEKTDS